MQPTDNIYKVILSDPNHYFESKITVNLGSSVATLTDGEIMSMKTTNSIFPSGNPQAGFAVSGELDVVIIKPSFDIPRAAEIRPYVRVCTKGIEDGPVAGLAVAGISIVGKADANSSMWLAKGVYYVDTRKVSLNSYGPDTVTIHAYDAMLKFDNPYPSDSGANYPKSDVSAVSFLAQSIGIGVDIRTWAVMTKNYSIPLPVGYTSREILGYIAGFYGGNFIINEVGELRLLKIVDIPVNRSILVAPGGDFLVFGADEGATRILLYAGRN